ncbi:MAG: peptidylprolyl isomerase [Hyphomicrobiaceae bacterium]
MSARSLLAFMVMCLAATLVTGPVAAQDKVIAKVNGRVITDTDLRYAEAEIGNDLGSIPVEQRRRVLVEYLIETHLFAEAGETAKLGTGQAYEERSKYWQRRALRDAYFDEVVRRSVTEAEARKLYDQQVAGAKQQEEVRARHILVESEVKAKEIFEKIAHGEDFARMAKEHSKDPGSKDEGGDLGYFSRGQMVPVFEETAFKLKKGDMSQPVQSQFGWHIIKLEDRRQRGAPPFDSIKERIMASLIHRRAQELGQTLRDKAKLEFVDPVLKAEVEKESQIKPVPAPAAPAPAPKK